MTILVTIPSSLRVGEFISPSLAVAASRAETTITLLTNISAADMLNPLFSLEAAIEVSFDDGATWEHELGFTWQGGPRGPLVPATLTPKIRISRADINGTPLPLRFRGALIRLRLVVPVAMMIGGSVEVT